MSTAAEQFSQSLANSLHEVVYGMDDTITGIGISLIAGGHILLEGAPGLGKTLIAKSLAKRLGRSFSRVQCTADLMPSDLTGVHVFNKTSNKFELVKGPLFADVVLVDEINRTGPKTQSALLQAMEEQLISLDRETYELSKDMLVIATQNPHEYEGTYPLIESQLDRFLLKLRLHYPDQSDEKQILQAYDGPNGGHASKPAAVELIDESMITAAREQAARVHVSEPVYNYATQIAAATRSHPSIELGLSTRGLLALMRCARAAAAMAGSEFLTPDNIKDMIHNVAAHRLILSADAMLEDVRAGDLLKEIVDQVDVPRSVAA